jgi:predicted Zn-dependent protease
MKFLFFALALTVPGLSGAQPLLDFREDLAFSGAEVAAHGVRAYGARLQTLRMAGKLDPDPGLKARLQRIVPQLLRAAAYERPDSARLAWEVHACTACDENASAQPGGKLLVSADFVARHRLSDDELAYLMAHEIAHVLAEHAREFATAARFFLDNGHARGYWDIQQELDESLPVALRMQSLGEQQELEADYMGFLIGARAGFEPQAMLGLLGKLAAGSGIVRSHPSGERRIAQARAMLDAARRLRLSAKASGPRP